MKVIIAVALLVFIIGGFIFLQMKNHNKKKWETRRWAVLADRPSDFEGNI